MRFLKLYRLNQSNKTYPRLLRCPICIEIRNKSKTFRSLHSLRYHLTVKHEKEPVKFSSISINEVRKDLENLDDINAKRYFIK